MNTAAPKHSARTTASTTHLHKTGKVKPKARPLRTVRRTLAQRVAALEQQLHQVKASLAIAQRRSALPWWERLARSFANDPLFDEMVAAGQAYRRAQNAQSRV
jgi:hypothetical protein